MIKNKKQMFIAIGTFAVVLMLLTVSYAFFNYTRTGASNTIRTGRISFSTGQTNTINLTNVFPISSRVLNITLQRKIFIQLLELEIIKKLFQLV